MMFDGFTEALKETNQGHIVEEVLGLQPKPSQSFTNNDAEQSKSDGYGNLNVIS